MNALFIPTLVFFSYIDRGVGCTGSISLSTLTPIFENFYLPVGKFTDKPAVLMGDQNEYSDYVGLLTDDNGVVVYELNAEYTQFSGVIGLGWYDEFECTFDYDDSITGDHRCRFYVDNVLVHTTPLFTEFADFEIFTIDLTNALELRIEVDDVPEADCIGNTIGNPQLSCVMGCSERGFVLGRKHYCRCQSECLDDDVFCNSMQSVANVFEETYEGD
eukprot:391446_1